MRLEGKVAVITGAGSGMGLAMAELFAREGAKIVAAEWNQETLDAAVAQVKEAGGEIVGVQADVSDRAQCEGMIDAAVDAYGKLDILCNNAGVMDGFAPAPEMDDEIWRRVLSINLDGPMFAIRKAVPIMVEGGGGSIINTASVAGLGGAAAGAAYTASKHAVIGLTKNTAWHYTMKGVRCNAIAAGGVETAIMGSVDQAKMSPPGMERMQVYAATNTKMLQSIDIANLALFLASDESANINGAIIPADAGWRSA